MPVNSLMAGVFSIIVMLQAGQLPGSLCASPSWLHPQGGQTYCFFSCADALMASVASVNEPATTNSLRFMGFSFRFREWFREGSLAVFIRGSGGFASKCGWMV